MQGNLNVLEQQIEPGIQVEYFECATRLGNDFDRNEVLDNRHSLFASEVTPEDKKSLLVKLAGIDDVEAYKTLELFLEYNQNELKEWAALALQENRLLLESRLLDENRVLISTGLGGKGLNLRYFTVFVTNTGKAFTPFEKTITAKELDYLLRKSDAELEQLQFDRELCLIISMIPLQVPVQTLFESVIAECNIYGGFLNQDYLITNVKILSGKQVRKMIRTGSNNE